MNILFICSRNKWRSRTAEALFRNAPGHQVRSAGTAASAEVRVNAAILRWAELIFVMEREHKRVLNATFRAELTGKTVVVLEIPDLYPFMHPELVTLLTDAVAPYGLE